MAARHSSIRYCTVGADGTGFGLAASDGDFNSPSEAGYADIPLATDPAAEQRQPHHLRPCQGRGRQLGRDQQHDPADRQDRPDDRQHQQAGPQTRPRAGKRALPRHLLRAVTGVTSGTSLSPTGPVLLGAAITSVDRERRHPHRHGRHRTPAAGARSGSTCPPRRGSPIPRGMRCPRPACPSSVRCTRSPPPRCTSRRSGTPTRPGSAGPQTTRTSTSGRVGVQPVGRRDRHRQPVAGRCERRRSRPHQRNPVLPVLQRQRGSAGHRNGGKTRTSCSTTPGTWSLFFDGSANGVGANGSGRDQRRRWALYFSTDSTTVPPGLGGTGDDADIYRWNGGNSYTRVIDASVVGWSTANVDGLVWVDATHVYLSYSADTNVPGFGARAGRGRRLPQRHDVVGLLQRHRAWPDQRQPGRRCLRSPVTTWLCGRVVRGSDE